MLEKLEKLKEEVLTNIDNIANLDDLNELKVKILGKKGEFTAIMKGMADIAADKIEIVIQRLVHIGNGTPTQRSAFGLDIGSFDP